VFRYIWGDDIFISYSRSDGAGYAAGVAAALAARKYSCKLDQWGTHPGKEMPAALLRALRRSHMLVLVGSPGAARSDAVRQEVTQFLTTKGMVVPIDFRGALREASWWPSVQGLPWSTEPPSALETGEPSPATISRIENTHLYTRKDQRLRRITAVTAAVLGVLLPSAAAAGVIATRQTRNALDAARAAGSARADALQQAGIAKTQRAAAEEARADAIAQSRLAAQQRAEAERQTKIAAARRLLAEAELAKSQGGDRVVAPANMALKAWNIYPVPEVDSVLRYALDRLPLSRGELKLPKSVIAIVFNEAREEVAATCEDGLVRVWNLNTGSVRSRALPGPPGEAALASDGSLIASGSGKTDSVAVYDLSQPLLPEIAHLTLHAKTAALAFSGDSRVLAVAGTDGFARVYESSVSSGIRSFALSATVGEAVEKREVRQVAASLDGSVVAIGAYYDDDDEGRYPVSVWQWNPVRKLNGSAGHHIRLSPNGRYIATARSDTWWLDDTQSEQPRTVLRVVEEDAVSDLFFPTDEFILSASRDGTVHLRNLENSGKEVARIDHAAEVNSVRMNLGSTDATLITTSGDRLRLWRADTSAKQPVFYEALTVPHGSPITAFAGNTTGTIVVVGGEDGYVRAWAKTYSGGRAGMEHIGPFWSSDFSPGVRFAGAGTHDDIRVFDVAKGTIHGVASGKVDAYEFWISQDGNSLVVPSGYQRPPQLWQLPGARPPTPLGSQEAHVALSDDRSVLLVYEPGKAVFAIRRGPAWERIGARQLGRPVKRLSPSPHGRFAAVEYAGGTHEVIALDSSSARRVGSMATFDAAETFVVSAVESSIVAKNLISGEEDAARLSAPAKQILVGPNASTVVVETTDNSLWLWNRGSRPVVMSRSKEAAERLALSNSGKMLFAGRKGSWTVVRLADRATIFSGTDSVSRDAAFSPGDNHLAIPVERSVIVCHVSDNEISRIAFDDEVRAVRFTSDNRHLVAVREQRTGVLLLHPEDVVAEVRNRLAKLPATAPAGR
jgi:WD40 repeat protein